MHLENYTVPSSALLLRGEGEKLGGHVFTVIIMLLVFFPYSLILLRYLGYFQGVCLLIL